MGLLEDRVAIVTGGTGALGRVILKEFLEEGAKVVCPYIDERELKEIMPLLRANKTSLKFVSANMNREKQAAKVVAKTIDSHGRVDILVNVIGAFVYSEIVNTDLSTLDRMLDINVKTTFISSKACLPHMMERNYGRIINISSRPALKGTKGVGAYSASKAAVLNLTESLADEMMDYDINVNAVLPSTIDTPANRASMPEADFSKWVNPRDLARVIVFLASEDSKAITGAGIPVYARA